MQNGLNLSKGGFVALSLLLQCVWICSCGTYDKTPSGGRFLGEARMVPVTPNNFFFYRPQDRDDVLFSYVPSPQGRFANRFEGNKITPDAMLTTGASVPRSLWGYSGLSPFDYTRAALIHDWLFEAHHRYEVGKWLSQYGTDEAKKRKGERLMQEYHQFASLTQDEASDLYAECIKALMEESQRMSADLAAKIEKDNNPMTAERLKDLRASLKDSRPSRFRIWAHHWTTSTRCIVSTGEKMWKAQHDDLGVYEALAGSDHAVKEGYMSKWLQKKFRAVYEEPAGAPGRSTSKLAGVSQSVDSSLLRVKAQASTLPARVYLEVGDAASQEILKVRARDFGGIELKQDKDFSGVSPNDLRVYYYRAEDRAEAEHVLKTVLAMLPPGYRPPGAKATLLNDGGLFRPRHYDLHVGTNVAQQMKR
ncbi:MAG: DUF1353 domain-containing protein [Prosthecobacter sp.]